MLEFEKNLFQSTEKNNEGTDNKICIKYTYVEKWYQYIFVTKKTKEWIQNNQILLIKLLHKQEIIVYIIL